MSISMQWKRRAAWLPLAAAFVALVGLGGGTPVAAAPPPANCAAIKAATPAATDGNYVITTGTGRILTVFCKDMATAPKEYLSLVNTGGAANFSQYTVGGASPGSSVKSSYTKVRLDPATLKVNIADQTFATSSGSLNHSGGSEVVTSMPYSVAMACVSSFNPAGLANIDLTGTPLAVATSPSPFQVGGFNASGNTTFSASNQVVNLTGGGFCGWNAPGPQFNPFNQTGGFDLPLQFLPFAFTGFFQPIDNPPTLNTVKAGSAVPVKFSLGGDQGLNIFAPGSPASRQVTCTTAAPLDDVEQTVTAGGSSLTYDATANQYIYVWKTEASWANTCRELVLTLIDGSNHTANFKFK